MDEIKIDLAERMSSPEHPVLQSIARKTHLRTVYPQMLSGHLQGTFLQWISQWLKPRIVVEVGTFTGYSAFCLSLGLAEGGSVHTIERNPELEELIHENLADHGLGSKIQLHLGEAIDIIPRLPMPIDLAYMDGDKHEYPKVFELLLPRMRPGGLILADNIFWDGKVADPYQKDKDTQGIRRFLELAEGDATLERLVLPLRDGLILLKVGQVRP